MSEREAENKQRMRQYLDAWNDHDPEAIVEYLSADCEQYTAGELREIAETWFTAFPDLVHDVDELAADGDRVLGRVTLRGTHRGTYRGIPPTGNEIEVSDHFSTRFEDGLIVEHHATADMDTLLSQLDATLSPGRTSEANEALVQQFFDAINDRDRAAFIETLAEDFTYGGIEGPEEMADMEWDWVEAMDHTWHVEEMYAGDDFVTTRARATGIHQGEILGLEPTGESFEATALMVSIIEDGKIVEWISEWDFAGILNQLGAIDSPVYND